MRLDGRAFIPFEASRQPLADSAVKADPRTIGALSPLGSDPARGEWPTQTKKGTGHEVVNPLVRCSRRHHAGRCGHSVLVSLNRLRGPELGQGPSGGRRPDGRHRAGHHQFALADHRRERKAHGQWPRAERLRRHVPGPDHRPDLGLDLDRGRRPRRRRGLRHAALPLPTQGRQRQQRPRRRAQGQQRRGARQPWLAPRRGPRPQ